MFFRHHRWSKIIDDWEPWKEFARNDNPNLINTGWQPAGVDGSFYKRVGDVLTIKFSFTGNGEDFLLASVPPEIFKAPQSYMFVVTGWHVWANKQYNVQVDEGGNNFTMLQSGNGIKFLGQLTVML